MGEPEVGDPLPSASPMGKSPACLVSMGNPHFVVFVPEFELGWQTVAEQISKHHGFQAWNECRVREGPEPGRDRGSLLRARCGRNHVLGDGFLRRGRGFHSRRQGEVAGPGAVRRGRHRRWSGSARCSSPDLQRYSAAVSFSFKISLPHGALSPSLNPSARLRCKPVIRLASLRPPAASGATSSRQAARTCCGWDIKPFYLPSIFDRELYFGGPGRAARRRTARDVLAGPR